MTNFQKVVEFNKNFGVLETSEMVPKTNVFDNQKLVGHCMKLIREEMGELEKAIAEKDYIETIDALADLIYVIHGASSRFGMDMDKAFNIVHENNMSKFCKTEEEAIDTVQNYKDKKNEFGYDSPSYRRAPDGIHWVVYNESDKKILKSINWKPVDLTVLL